MMKQISIAACAALAGCAQAPIALKDMGSFHVGGREMTVSGKPVKEVTFAPGGVPAKVDPNGVYQVEQMYVQYFIPQNERGALPLLMWHGGGLTGVTYESTLRFFHGHGFVSGNPVREAFLAVGPRPGAGGERRVLVFGGSQGAHAINQAMLAAAAHVREIPGTCSIVHQTGERDL